MSNPSSEVRLRAPAKINLLLEVTDRRPDGYHEIDSIFVPVELADEVHVIRGAGPGHAPLIDCDDPSIPLDQGNTVSKAIVSFYGDRPVPPLRVKLRKRIPAGAGLGGGSSDAAAVLRALSQLEGRRSSPAEGARVALAVGADVPFFLRGCAARVRGVGERVDPLPDLEWPVWIVLAWPGIAVSTRWAYEQLDLALTWPRPADRIQRFLSEARAPGEIYNDFETIVGRRHPRILELKQRLLSLGAEAAGMSGSGSAVFGTFPDAARAGRAERSLRGQGLWAAATRRLQGTGE